MECMKAMFDSIEKGSKAGLAEQVELFFKGKLQHSLFTQEQTISNTPGKTAVFLQFFVSVKQAKHKHTEVNRICTLQLKH